MNTSILLPFLHGLQHVLPYVLGTFSISPSFVHGTEYVNLF